MKKTEQTLSEAMSFAAVRSIPQEWDGTSDFTLAIAKVLKSNNVESYVIIRRLDDGTNIVIRDFGDVASIVKTIAIYPYEFTSRKPLFRYKRDKVKYVVEKHLVRTEEDAMALSPRELDKLIDDYWDKD